MVSFSNLHSSLTDPTSVLCGDYGIKQIDEPFIHANEQTDDWTV